MVTDAQRGQVGGVLHGRARSRQTAHEFVRETIRRSILSGELPGGTRLVQAELAEALDVSTTPVREALRDLASEGLVQLDAHRGGIVRELQPDELTEIYEIRKILEPEAMRLAVGRITDEALQRFEDLHEQMQQSDSAVDFLLLNREFHLSMYDAVDSPRLMGILTGLLDASAMYVGAAISSRPDLRIQAVADHVDILAAIRSGDADAAAAAILDHLRIPQLFFDEE